MRIDPIGVYLRLEPGATLISHTTGRTRTTPVVELHWKSAANRWLHRSFVANDDAPTLGAVLTTMGKWLDTFPDIQAALDSIEAPPPRPPRPEET